MRQEIAYQLIQKSNLHDHAFVHHSNVHVQIAQRIAQHEHIRTAFQMFEECSFALNDAPVLVERMDQWR